MSPRAVTEPLAPALLRAFAVELRRALGLVFPPTRAEAFESGIVRAAAALREVPASLLLRLASVDGAAIEALAVELTIGETYFFRHAHHFEFLRESLRSLARGRSAGDPIRLWSAGCSSGEEAYSMAIAALEVIGPAAERTVEILATDVNAEAVARARAATYGEWSFRDVTPEVRARWFEPEGPRFRVAAAPRSMVRFVERNLLDGPPPTSPGDAWSRGIDVIFCRNVLIYFEPAAIARVAERLGSALAAGGVMVPGPSDPLLRSAGLVVNGARDLISYARAGEPIVAVAAPVGPRAKAAAPTPRPTPDRLIAGSISIPAPVAATTHDDVIARARRLADGGDLVTAAELIDAALAADPLQEEAYLLRAVLAQARGDHAGAAADADRAILLHRAFAFAHVIAASSRAHLGERVAARRHLRNAQRLLAALRADATAPGSGGVTAHELLHSCRQLDRSLASIRVPARAAGARR
jgi:chemotaxis protein methyltransferase CheR